jgi:hypothetical protein
MTPSASTAYYAFEPCCGGNTLYFAFNSEEVAEVSQGINIYVGSGAVGYDPTTGATYRLTNQCYKVFRGTANDGGPITESNYGDLPMVPTGTPGNFTFDSITNYESTCEDAAEDFCPECEAICYTIYSCDGSYPPITVSNDLSAYVGTSISIQVEADFGYSCFYVVEASSCSNAVVVTTAGAACNTCECTCYEIFGTGKLNYIDCNGNEVVTTVNGYWKDCALTYPFTSPVLQTVSHGDCINGQCPGDCYELTDCEGLQESIFTTAQSLSPFATLGQVVIIEGYTNCWEVTDVVSCDCAIDVVVLQAYDTCRECNPDPNYKLVNCDDTDTIVYTSTDLSEYVGKVVQREAECPGCWIVYEVNGPIPSDAPITVTEFFDDCEACKAIYYRLTDCTDTEADIITSTDLSDYVGSTIILEWCPTTCWTVSVSQTSVGAGVLGDIVNEFVSCLTCLNSFPCVCKRIKNHDSVAHNYDYVDCNGVVQTISLLSGERSDRICMKLLLTSFTTDYVETFGNCTNGVCPPQTYPKRTVRPGYSTPICSTEKYEKITCKSAEALYKQVLELRYGISNCCPEEDARWLLKKEIIDLQALVDPDYTCTHLSCGCAPSTCSCGTTNTCNSH